MSPLALLLGGGVAALVWLASRAKDTPEHITMRAGEWYEVTLDIEGHDGDLIAHEIGQAGGVIDLDSPDGTLVFEMRSGIDLPVSVPGELPGFEGVVITEIRKVDRE